MTSNYRRLSWVFLLLLVGVIAACLPKSTPPGDNSISGVVEEGASYSFHYWNGGLAILVWQDFSYGSGEACSGTGSTEDPVYRLECDVSAEDGRKFSWTVHTGDGVTGEMWIDGQPFNLDEGSMFLVRVSDGNLQIKQIQRDLSELERSSEAISALASSDLDVADFIASFGAANASPGTNN